MGIFEILWLCLLVAATICGVTSIDTSNHNIIDKILLYMIPILILAWMIIATGLLFVKDNINIY
jgi:hypothetical protein